MVSGLVLAAVPHNPKKSQDDNCRMPIRNFVPIRRCKSLPGCSEKQSFVEIDRPGFVYVPPEGMDTFERERLCLSRSSSNVSSSNLQSEAESNRLMAPVMTRLKKEEWSYNDALPLESQIYLGWKDEAGNGID